MSANLLCLRSNTLSCFKFCRESGREVREFSLSASVLRFNKQPISFGNDDILLPGIVKFFHWLIKEEKKELTI